MRQERTVPREIDMKSLYRSTSCDDDVKVAHWEAVTMTSQAATTKKRVD